jgi:hypothetical protein
MSRTREELIHLAEAFTNETDTEGLLQLSTQLLEALDRLEAEQNKTERVA